MQNPDNKLRILSWNINGIRSSKVPLKSLFDSLDADIICLQETKVTRDLIDSGTAIVEGYNAYFSFSKKRSGYSGVATYCRKSAAPFSAQEGLSTILDVNKTSVDYYTECLGCLQEELLALDSEGRALITHHYVKIKTEDERRRLAIINVYCPRADVENEDRIQFKIQFYKLLEARALNLISSGSCVVIVGDVNTSHKSIDHCDPGDINEFVMNPGRRWLDNFLCDVRVTEFSTPEDDVQTDDAKRCKFVDTFRYFYPHRENAFTCWHTLTNARMTNYGTRLDYILADERLTRTCFTDSIILADVEGSDHCPVKAVMECACIPSETIPDICSKNWPEFTGKQQKLSKFFAIGRNNAGSNNQDREKRKFEDTGIAASTEDANCSRKKKKSTILNYFAKTDSNFRVNKIEAILKHDMEFEEMKPKVKATNKDSINAWKNLLKGAQTAPLCKGHNEPCLLRTVKKEGANYGRKFYVCSRPIGHAMNAEATCNHFQWVTPPKISTVALGSRLVFLLLLVFDNNFNIEKWCRDQGTNQDPSNSLVFYIFNLDVSLSSYRSRRK